MLDVEIRIKGRIDEDWSEWLGGLIIIPTGGGETHLIGRVRDQAMLRGLLTEIADLGLELISVTTLPQSEKY
jgi:uncharacterized membrane protein